MRKLLLSLCLVCIAVFAVACKKQDGGENAPSYEVENPTFYTVTFVQDGQADEVKRVEAGKNIQAPAIKATPPTGYSYEWERTDFSKLTEDCTVRLKAVPNVYTVYYEIGDDSHAAIESKTQSVVYDGAFSPLIPTRFGYTFEGWVIKDTDEPFEPKTYTVAGDTYLVAKWALDIDSDRWFTPDF